MRAAPPAVPPLSCLPERDQALVVTALGNQRAVELLRPKLETIMDLASEPSPVHGYTSHCGWSQRSLSLSLSLSCSIRVTGSAAVNMCLVASGQSDAYYENGIHCWDIAAGHVIVREAGGVSMMPNGETCGFLSTNHTHTHAHAPHTGDNLDVMKRGILCSSTSRLAFQLVPTIRHVHYPAD